MRRHAQNFHIAWLVPRSRCVMPNTIPRNTERSPDPSMSPDSPCISAEVSMSQYAGRASQSKPSPFHT
jgi:hypothetical protein